MSKKLLAVLGLLVVLSMLLVACGGNEVVENNTTDTTTDDTNTGETTTEETEEPDTTTEEPVATEEPEPTEEPVVRTTRTGGWLDTIAMSVVSSDAAVTQIEAGAIDLYASNLSTPADFAAISAGGLERSTQFGLYYEITLNPSGPVFESTGKLNPFASTKMREAMNWLIDRDYINQEIYGGNSIPKWVPFLAGFPDYARNIEVIKPIEVKYAYNPEKAREVITTEMEAFGAEMVDGKWTFEGEPVVLTFLIRTDSDGTRLPMGDIISNWLEDEGFTVDRLYGTSSELSPYWIGGNPADGEWHLYTGAWGIGGIPRNDGDNFQFFYTPGSAYGSLGLWQAYDVSEEYQTLANDLANNNYTTMEERTEMFADALVQTMEYSFRVWVVDGVGASTWKPELNVSYDLAAGVDINGLTPFTLRYDDQEGGLVKWGTPDLFVEPVNPISGSNWTYDHQFYDMAADFGVLLNPFTGVALPQRIERAEVTVQTGLPVSRTYDWVDLSFEDEIPVPADVWVDWDVENQVFVTVGEAYPDGLTALVKSVAYYPAELWDITWHDGSNLDLADFIMPMIMTFEIGTEGSAVYDESQAANLEAFKAAFKGFRFVSADPLVVEWYTDNWQLDAENNVTTLFPYYDYGQAPWHGMAVSNMAEASGELAYSPDKADALEIEWTNYLGGPSLEILSAKLDEAIAGNLIPYEPTLGAYITAEDAAARYANLKAFVDEHDHFYVGTGPYFIDEVRLVEKAITMSYNPNYPDLADKWAIFSVPKLAEVAVDGAGRVPAGAEAMFDVFVTFQGEPYPDNEISQVKYLLFGPDGALVESGAAELVTDGQYLVTLSEETTGAFEAGAYKLEAVVVAIPVAIPSFGDFEFVSE